MIARVNARTRFVMWLVLSVIAIPLVEGPGPGSLASAQEYHDPICLRERSYEVNERCEVRYEVPGDWAITSVALRASDGRITTLHLTLREIRQDGTLGESKRISRGSEPHHYPEASTGVPEGYVAVGFGVSLQPFWDVTTVSLWGAKFHQDGTLGDPVEFRGGFKAEQLTQRQILLRGNRLLTGIGIGSENHAAVRLMAQSATASRYPEPEKEVSGVRLADFRLEPSERTRITFMAPPRSAVTGIGIRAAEGCISSMQINTREILPDGTLGKTLSEGRGWFPWHEPEGPPLNLPDSYVAVGVGLSISPLADVKTVYLWGAPLNKDGTLGAVEEFRAGFQREPGGDPPQKSIRLEPGRVLTGFGFWINDYEALGIMATSAKLVGPE